MTLQQIAQSATTYLGSFLGGYKLTTNAIPEKYQNTTAAHITPYFGGMAATQAVKYVTLQNVKHLITFSSGFGVGFSSYSATKDYLLPYVFSEEQIETYPYVSSIAPVALTATAVYFSAPLMITAGLLLGGITATGLDYYDPNSPSHYTRDTLNYAWTQTPNALEASVSVLPLALFECAVDGYFGNNFINNHFRGNPTAKQGLREAIKFVLSTVPNVLLKTKMGGTNQEYDEGQLYGGAGRLVCKGVTVYTGTKWGGYDFANSNLFSNFICEAPQTFCREVSKQRQKDNATDVNYFIYARNASDPQKLTTSVIAAVIQTGLTTVLGENYGDLNLETRTTRGIQAFTSDIATPTTNHLVPITHSVRVASKLFYQYTTTYILSPPARATREAALELMVFLGLQDKKKIKTSLEQQQEQPEAQLKKLEKEEATDKAEDKKAEDNKQPLADENSLPGEEEGTNEVDTPTTLQDNIDPLEAEGAAEDTTTDEL